MKNVYFLADAHLGSLAVPHRREQERRLVRFLDEVKQKAGAIYMLGDMFDFWFEYRNVVPRGFTRFLGKVSELTDAGVEVHFFTGNHDLWCLDYLERECGMTVHRGALTLEMGDRTFFLAHGDGLGDDDRLFRLLRHVFHNGICQWAFRWLHPDIGVRFGLGWAKSSRLRHGSDTPYKGEGEEPLVQFAKKYLAGHPGIDYFIFGHRHIELELALNRQTRIIVLGDWISQFTYAVFDGEALRLENYTEGEGVV